MEVRLAGICYNSLVNGPGMRTVIFAQGCNHHCKGCFNPETWEFSGGKLFDIDKLVEDILSDVLVTGVTFSGGDPIEQAGAFAEIALKLKKAGKDIWCYTGYTWEELMMKIDENNTNISNLLANIDVLVDGEFNEDLHKNDLRLRGSSNQRIIDVQSSTRNRIEMVSININ